LDTDHNGDVSAAELGVGLHDGTVTVSDQGVVMPKLGSAQPVALIGAAPALNLAAQRAALLRTANAVAMADAPTSAGIIRASHTAVTAALQPLLRQVPEDSAAATAIRFILENHEQASAYHNEPDHLAAAIRTLANLPDTAFQSISQLPAAQRRDLARSIATKASEQLPLLAASPARGFPSEAYGVSTPAVKQLIDLTSHGSEARAAACFIHDHQGNHARDYGRSVDNLARAFTEFGRLPDSAFAR
jgi:hypothetical protein